MRGAALFAQAPAPGLLGCIDCHSENPHLNNFGNIWVGRNAVALIERAPEEELASGTRFRNRLRLDTYGHYAVHTAAIVAWRKKSLNGR